MQFSDKTTVNELVALCTQAGIREVVHSPGSRNAPLAFSFAACETIRLLTIVDERSAAFFALGMAQQLRRPVALICTSGTAVLNYAPAIAEAYYQRVPLVVITADRPPEWIDQADGQTIRQHNIYANYIGYSTTVENGMWKTECENALRIAFTENLPIHINVPLDEPLYNRVENGKWKTENLQFLKPDFQLSTFNFQLSTFDSILILVGQQQPNEEVNSLLGKLAENHGVTVLCESTSNLHNERFVGCIDRVLATIPKEDLSEFAPDLLITFDGQVVSKRIKSFLRNCKPREHWHIGITDPAPDTYRCLTKAIKASPVDFLKSATCKSVTCKFQNKWLQQSEVAKQRHELFVNSLAYCDLKLFSILKNAIPAHTLLQIANSTPIRYVQLFEEFSRFDCYANRGTSGIDGCTSTAAGAAFAAQRPTLLITGDLSFLYDSNALWNNYLRPDFRIIVINNGGGGIFRYISGEMPDDEMARLFEVTQRQVSIELLTKSYGLEYFGANNEAELASVLPAFFNSNSPTLLEIKTSRMENAEKLKEYFAYLQE
ncbi:MAG: 2-succinyl-5-enolpyruvyl-6-hydroxy-3-cyclohexene-1-carboxylic-acid synthase [Prevotellaceae bacterium]|jgi:2-succinyl-5-enolpyruvyl-6-hydroxy-3-cyclohexene-1-carboxylate synthase|nr:2-succinyl-5-enolpyruvyl-6-hydroxy-3-cyclohexene-1-carboxylic-acid synthase [Prevotellaceae bacterium]